MDERTPASTFDDLSADLSNLRIRAGEPSFSDIAKGVAALRDARGASAWKARPGRITVYDAFKSGRKRIDIELVLDIVSVLGQADRREEWRSAYHDALRRRPAGTARPRIEEVRRAPAGALRGRTAEIDHLTHRLATAAHDSPATAVALVTGLAGVGKTAVARAVAHDLTTAIPGAFAVEASLRTASGDDATATATPAQVIAAVEPLLLRASTHDAETVPRCVVLIDDVVTAHDLTALADGLPAGSVVVATSRRELAVPDAVAHLRLPPLGPAAATRVLREGLPPERFLAEGDEATLHRLAGRCGGLPLALTILAGQIAAHPTWALADIERWLPHAVDRLDGFLEAAYEGLGVGSRRALHLCALDPARLTSDELAALLAADLEEAAEQVDVLVREHLLERDGDGRLDVHDLVRTFAERRSIATEPYSQVRLAVERLAWFLLSGDPAATTPGDEPSFDWFEDHVEVIVTTAQLAADHELPREVTRLADLCHVHLRRTIRDSDSLIILDAARQHGLPEERLEANRRYLQILIYQHRFAQAAALGEQLVARVDDPGRVRSQVLLAEVYRHSGRFEEARAMATSALETGSGLDPFTTTIARTCLTICALRALDLTTARSLCEAGLATLDAGEDDPHIRATHLFYLAHTYLLEADWERAETITQQCLALAESVSRHDLVESCRLSIGSTALRRGRVVEALALITHSVERARALSETFMIFDGLQRLGAVQLAAGRVSEAAGSLLEARGLAATDDVPQAEVSLGDLALAQGDLEVAERRYRGALADLVDDARAQHLALRGLGDVAVVRGDRALARRTWLGALALDPPGWYAEPLRERLAGPGE